MKSKWYESQVRQSRTRLYLDRGDAQKAIAEANIVIALAEQTGDGHLVYRAHLFLCEANLLDGEFEEARSLIDTIDTIDTIDNAHQNDGDLMLVGLSRRIRSRVLVWQAEYEGAVAEAAQSVSAFEALGNKYHVALS